MIARLFKARSRADGSEHAGVIVRIVAFQQKPVIQVSFAGPIHPASAGKIAIEVQLFIAAEAHGIRRSNRLVDQIAELVREVTRGNAKAIRTEILVDSEIDRAAALGPQQGIAGVAWICSKGFEN